ncbi:MAG: transferase [Deltaproteobacteria bacterium]|nr:transferase [Deltaproteobacteria bacterium]
MLELERLYERIIQRTNINLRELGFGINPDEVQNLISLSQIIKFYAYYGITTQHPIDFQFKNSNLSGSYFLGKCKVTNSLLYKSDIRGDELKKKGDIFIYKNFTIPIKNNESIDIQDSMLIKTLVHNFSHDPETPEQFLIKDTVSLHCANIHGSTSRGCYLEPFATVDLTAMRDCVIGAFSYIQTGEINRMNIKPGTIWVRDPDSFNFLYRHPAKKLAEYINFQHDKLPTGKLIDFVATRKEDFQVVFETINKAQTVSIPSSASLDRYAVTKSETRICENVMVAQRAYLQNVWLGKGANVQENCYIINSRLERYNVTAHGAKIVEADLGEGVFVGFNSFLRGQPNEQSSSRLTIGKGSIIMPHTIIDISDQLHIPDNSLVWGLIKNKKELETNSIPIKEVEKNVNGFSKGDLFFEGDGAAFIKAFKDRIQHILEANGAFYDGKNNKGHAQKNQNMSFNTIQPYSEGDYKGLYPTITIQP